MLRRNRIALYWHLLRALEVYTVKFVVSCASRCVWVGGCLPNVCEVLDVVQVLSCSRFVLGVDVLLIVSLSSIML